MNSNKSKKRQGIKTQRFENRWSLVYSGRLKFLMGNLRSISQNIWLRPSRKLSNTQTYWKQTLKTLKRSIVWRGISIESMNKLLSVDWEHNSIIELAKTVMINWERKRSLLLSTIMSSKEKWPTKGMGKTTSLKPWLTTLSNAWKLWESTSHLVKGS